MPILGVYSRNRNFRLFLSSKLGKKSHLRLAKENAFKVTEYSLVCIIIFHTTPIIIARQGWVCENKKESVNKPVHGYINL